MNKEWLDDIYNEFSHMSALIIIYGLDMEKIRCIINKLEGVKCKYTKCKIDRNKILIYLRAYLVCPDSKIGLYFKDICHSNGVTTILNDLSLEYNSKKIIK